LLFKDNYPDDLDEYIKKKEKDNNINLTELRTSKEIKLPNGEFFDFSHLFATIEGIKHSKLYNHFIGWGGDTVSLLNDTQKEKGTLDELINKENNFFNHKESFGPAGLISNLDASIVLNKKRKIIIFQK